MLKAQFRLWTIVMALLTPTLGFAQISFGSSSGKWYYGAGFGLAAGGVTSVNFSPYVGYRLTDQFSLGVNGSLRYRNDDRYSQTINTIDYGAGVFGRYYFAQYFFAQAEYGYLNYQFLRGDNVKDRRGVSSVLGGGGVAYPIGNNATVSATVLYNFSYGSYSSPSPYGSPWVFRVGVGIGF